jgi:proteasome lid subunit RPN8/RPN11
MTVRRPEVRAFYLPFREFRRLARRARDAQRAKQFEVVGLLATKPSTTRVLHLVFLRNRATRPCQWKVRSEDVAASRHALERDGFRAIGLFHSHPITKATLGPRDRRSTPSGWYHLVFDVCALEPRLYVVRRFANRRLRTEEVLIIVERSNRIRLGRRSAPARSNLPAR